ncbi:hypothetical protein QYZ88_006310 [Lachnospiraceae bacterium C1.1]|nr:hypothetical protein [Lachnospiraceae bacterium C1.1]
MNNFERFEHSYLMLLHWLEAIHLKHDIVDFFLEEGIKNIALYGMGDLANRIIDSLSGTSVNICYGIDQDVAGTVCRINAIYSLDDALPRVDAIIVMPFYAYDEIKKSLEDKINTRIISIEEVIWSI